MKDVRDQFILEGKIRNSKSGGDVITFNMSLGFIDLTFIVTVPMEGTDVGPVYVKYSFKKDLARKWFDPKFKPID